jgi:ABC-type bacteriocin/lantibiotic exporter with double-glycine peptidase domain
MLRIHGIGCDYQALTDELYAASPDGFNSLTDLKKAAGRRGLALEVGRTTPEALLTLEKPVVAHIEPLEAGGGGHFILVLSADEDTVICMDGTTAMVRKRSWREFAQRWSGHILYPAPPASAAQVWAGYLAVGLLGAGAALVLATVWPFRRGPGTTPPVPPSAVPAPLPQAVDVSPNAGE